MNEIPVTPKTKTAANAEIIPTIKNEGEQLCVSCSMCCEGILYGKLAVTEDERDRLGPEADYFEDNGQLCLRLGCKLIGANGACQRYANRPKGCGDYKCSTLKKVENNEISYEDALAKVSKARALNDACLIAAHEALTDEYWNHDLMKTAIQAFLRTQVVIQAGIPVAQEKADKVAAAWDAFCEHVTTHFVDHVAPDVFHDSLIIMGGPFDKSRTPVTAD